MEPAIIFNGVHLAIVVAAVVIGLVSGFALGWLYRGESADMEGSEK